MVVHEISQPLIGHMGGVITVHAGLDLNKVDAAKRGRKALQHL